MNFNYYKSTLKFIQRNKVFTFINFFGLTLALATSFIIILFVINELSYDRCYEKRDQIYRVVTKYLEYDQTLVGTPFPMAEEIKETFPQVKYTGTVRVLRSVKFKLNEEYISLDNPLAASSDIFKIFQFPLQGIQNNVLDEMNTIILSQKQAQKFFPEGSAIGKEIIALVNGIEEVFTVRAVFYDIPANSSFVADCFVNITWSIIDQNRNYKSEDYKNNWNTLYWKTWIELNDKADLTNVDYQFRELEKDNYIDDIRYNFRLQNLSDVYLPKQRVFNNRIEGNMKNIKTFSVIALLIILVASFNYIILSTALSSERVKEIGIRKTNGASTASIRTQLLSESVLLSIVVVPFALLIAWVAKPFAEELFQTELVIIPSNIIFYLVSCLLLTTIIGIVSGLYTSSYLSRLSVINILSKSNQGGGYKKVLRYGLVVAQLTVFTSFVSSMIIIQSQYKHTLNKDVGFHKEDVLLIDLGRSFKHCNSFSNSLRAYSEIINVGGATDYIPTYRYSSYMQSHFKDEETKIETEILGVGYDFVETMGIKLLQGRSFSREFSSDAMQSILVNETALSKLGIDNPIGATIGEKIIVGVVKDFNLHSVRSEIPPLCLTLNNKRIRQLAIHYKHGCKSSVLSNVRKEWKKIVPDSALDNTTVDVVISEMYEGDKNLSKILMVFALFTLLIATLGLLGLTLYMAKSQSRENGIKKVFGCPDSTIILVFFRQKILLAAIASCISIPITYMIMSLWLSGYAYKIDISLNVFIISFLLSTVVVLTTVFFYSYYNSRLNPIRVLVKRS